MAFEIGYSTESINALMDRFENHHKLIKYNPETREVAIINWGKYNFPRSGTPIENCVRNELSKIKDISLIKLVGEKVENEKIRLIYRNYVNQFVELDENFRDGVRDDSRDGGNNNNNNNKNNNNNNNNKHNNNNNDEKFSKCVSDYFTYFGKCLIPLSPTHAQEIESYIQDGVSESLIIKAVDEAISKGIRDYRYIKGILNKWINAGVFNDEQLENYNKQYFSRGNKNEFDYKSYLDSRT
jgi:DnaD/phage-associated family protein